MSSINDNPFVGARSYEEEDQYIFFGREQEANDLFQLVNINSFTLLYGKSGLGKTSVLQAGLFPKSRNSNSYPIYVRPNYRDTKANFIKEAENIIENKFKATGYTYKTFKPKGTLWQYFHRQPLKNNKGNNVAIVLVFDQFEEIFTLGTQDKSSELRENTRRFIEFLSDLIENSPPRFLSEEQRVELQFEFGAKKPPVKIIFSFREEYLGDFYELSKYIPSIAYSNLQYKLNPLTFEKAYHIIKSASRGLFEPEIINQTLMTITESMTVAEAQKRDIDSFLLSIFCENQFEVLRGKDNKSITAEEIGKVDIQNLVYNKYQSIINELKLNQDEKRLLEERLVSPEGFRLPIYLDIALDQRINPNIRREIIEALQERKILKQYFIDGRWAIEIIHDKYALAIKSERDLRLQDEEKYKKLEKDREELERKRLENERELVLNQAIAKQKELQLLKDENELELQKAIAKQKELELSKEKKELERGKSEAEKKLALRKGKITTYAFLFMIITIVIAAYLVVHNKTVAENAAYSVAAIYSTDTIRNEKVTLEVLIEAYKNINGDSSKDRVLQLSLKTAEDKIKELFNNGDFGNLNVCDTPSVINNFSVFNNDSNILATFGDSSTNSPISYHSILYVVKNGGVEKQFKHKAAFQVENSNYIAEIDSPRIRFYDDVNGTEPFKAIYNSQFFQNQNRVWSIQYYASDKTKLILVLTDNLGPALYDAQGNLKKSLPPDTNKNEITTTMLLNNGNILIVKQKNYYNSSGFYSTECFFKLLKKDDNYNFKKAPFIFAQKINISPTKNQFLVKIKNSWKFYGGKNSAPKDLHDTLSNSQAKFDSNGNFIIVNNSAINAYDANGDLSYVYSKRDLDKKFSIMDFKSPYLLFGRLADSTKIPGSYTNCLLIYNLKTKKEDSLRQKFSDLVAGRLSSAADSLSLI